jgi:hypothetical protein
VLLESTLTEVNLEGKKQFRSLAEAGGYQLAALKQTNKFIHVVKNFKIEI